MSKFKVGQRVISNEGKEGVIESIDYKLQNNNIMVNFNGDYEFFKLDGTSYYDSDFKIKPLEHNNDDYFRKGDTVFCAVYGEGVVEDINDERLEGSPIRVFFYSTQSSNVYTKDGRYLSCSNVTLSQKPIPPIINEPLPPVFNLSFVEAMELVLKGEKLNCKLWLPEEYIKVKDKVVRFYYFNSEPGDFNYTVQVDEMKAKWCIIA